MSGLAVATGVMGIAIAMLGLSALAAPSVLREAARRFPRSAPAAWILTALALLWSGVWLYRAPFVADISWARTAVCVAMPVAFVLLVAFLEELLAVRALGGILLLAPSWLLNAAFVSDARWKAVVVVLAYVMVVAGMILVMSPYRFRTTAEAALRSDARSRAAGAVGLAAGAVLLALAFAVYR